MSAAALRMTPYRYKAEARFSAISCPRGTLASFCPHCPTASSGLGESLPRRLSLCAAGVRGPPSHACGTEIPWLGRRSSLGWGIEGQPGQFIMTLDEGARFLQRTRYGQTNGGDGWPPRCGGLVPQDLGWETPK